MFTAMKPHVFMTLIYYIAIHVQYHKYYNGVTGRSMGKI